MAENKIVSVQILAVIVIVGALLRKEYTDIGHWLTVAALVCYIVINAKSQLKNTKLFKLLPTKGKVRVIIFYSFVYIALDAVINMSLSYFAVLVLFAIDYLLTDTEKPQE